MKVLGIQHIPAQGQHEARVRVSYRSQEGAATQEREVPFAFAVAAEQQALLQWYLEKYLEFPWGEFRTRAQRAEQLMQELGGALFEAVFDHREVRPFYERVADDLAHTRIVIYASSPEGIALPWELLRDPLRGEFGDLAPRAFSFVRSQPDLVFEPPSPKDDPAFHILLVICRPGGGQDIPFQSEARPLLELLRPYRDRVQLDVLRPPTLEQLARVVANRPGYYHVLHFDGHGAFPQAHGAAPDHTGANGQGQLLFEGEDGEPKPVTGEQLGQVLAGKGIPLVLLNACQSGMTHPEALYPSVGNQLLRAGTAAVVAMSFSVHVAAAVRFMARLYEGLVQGEELARAVALGREALRVHPERFSPIGEMPLHDWIVPVAFEAVPVRLTQAPLQGLHLDVGMLQDRQQTAGQEVGCPEPPSLGFIGRDAVLLDLERAFQRESIVLLQGMAGIGKTEAAMGFARWRAETGGLDGPIFFFRFEHYLPLALVCDRVGRQFEHVIKEQLHADWQLLDAEQRRRVVLAVLRGVPCLLIWDNFEPVVGFPEDSPSDWTTAEQQALRNFLHDLRGGQTKVLLTSRRDEPWLGPIYQQIEMRGLTLLEAQELAVKILERAGLSAAQLRKLSEYNDLLEYLGGNPLALRVALPELRRQAPRALLAALRTGAAELSGDAAALGRERSLAASLGYCLEALSPLLHRRLGVLALFQGFVDPLVLAIISAVGSAVSEEPELIRGMNQEAWVRALDTAAEIGILQRVGAETYTAHPALPWFFDSLRKTAFPTHQAWLEQAFAAAYGEYGRILFQARAIRAETVIGILGSEEDNLRYALRLGLRHERWSAVEGVLLGLSQLMRIQGRWVEWDRLIAELEADVTDARGEPLAGREELWLLQLWHRQEIASVRRDFGMQEAILQQLREHYERAGDEGNVAGTLHQLGVVAQQRRQWDEAESYYRQSLVITKRLGNDHTQASTLHDLGAVAQGRRQWDEAEKYYLQSLAITKRVGDELVQANTLHNLGMVAQERRQWDEAEKYYLQSLAITKSLGDELVQASTLHQLGIVAQERRHWDEAETYYRQGLAIKERIGDEHAQAGTMGQLGKVAQERRQWHEAEGWYSQSLAIAERTGDQHSQAITLHQLGMVAQDQGKWDEAEKYYRQSLVITKCIGDEFEQASTLYQMGLVAQHRRRLDKAEEYYRHSLAITKRLGDERLKAMSLGQLGLVAHERRQWDKAKGWYRQSLAAAKRNGDERVQAISLQQLGMVAEERGNVPEAIRLYKAAENLFVSPDDLYDLELVRTSLRRLRGEDVNGD